MKISAKISIVLASVIAAASVGTVSATWYYKSGAADEYHTSIGNAEMGENWETDNLLLTSVIDALNDEDSNLSTNLNSRLSGHGVWSSGNIVNYFISLFIGDGDKDYYGSMDPMINMTYLGNDVSLLEEDIIDDSTSNLSYIVKYISDTQMYLYICNTYLGESGTIRQSGLSYVNSSAGNPTVPIGGNIYHIYRTTLTRTDTDSDWGAVDGETMIDGYAPSCWYEEMREWTPIIRQTPSYDINNWKSVSEYGELGDSVSNAIWTFNGDSHEVIADTVNTSVYYQLQAASNTYYFNYSSGTYTYYGVATRNDSSVNNYCYNYTSGSTASSSDNYAYNPSYSYNTAGSYTITASSSNVAIIVYSDSALTTVAASNLNGNVITGNSVTFTASSAATYYIQVYGAMVYTLSVELVS